MNWSKLLRKYQRRNLRKLLQMWRLKIGGEGWGWADDWPQWTTLLQSWRTNSLLNVILMMRLNNNMSIWYRSSRYLSIKLMANTLGRLSLLNSFKSPGTFSETLDLDQKLQIILILQRQQYWHKHFPWFEQRFHCFTLPYWSVLLVFVF